MHLSHGLLVAIDESWILLWVAYSVVFNSRWEQVNGPENKQETIPEGDCPLKTC